MDAQSPQIVGIVGGSCAGKSWLAGRLQSALQPRAARLSLDDFYQDRSHLPAGRRARLNFDHPRAIDWERLEAVLARLGAGQAADVPRYDFATHGRVRGDFPFRPAPVLIVEGLWLFRRPSLRNRFTLKIFIRSTPELCMERRLTRDTAERGRTPAQVVEQFERQTLPGFNRFVAPQERWADTVLEAPISEEALSALINQIEELSSRCIGI